MKTNLILLLTGCIINLAASYAQNNISSSEEGVIHHMPWLLRGNKGTNPAINFIGTKDAQPLVFRVNNKKAGYLDFRHGNTSFGYQSLNVNTSLNNTANTAIGYKAMYSNVYGYSSVAIGAEALYTNSVGYDNIAIGNKALYLNKGGHHNHAIGSKAMYSNEFGEYNVAIGDEALFTGFFCSENIAIGHQALYSNLDGYENIAIGWGSLYSNTRELNIAIGGSALYSNTTGFGNTALGYSALYSSTTSGGNTALGLESLLSNTTGGGNTASGGIALGNNTTGSFNTAFGSAALYSNTTGNNNTALGRYADVTAGHLTNATSIGYNAVVDASNKVRIGDQSVKSIGGQVGWSQFSDERVKKEVKENVPGLDFIEALRPVTYHFSVDKEDELMGVKNVHRKAAHPIAKLQVPGSKYDEKDFADIDIPGNENEEGKYDIEKIQFTGFFAQDVEKAAQRIGYDFSGVDKTGKIWGLRYGDFVVPLVKAVQELSQQNYDLKKQNDELKLRLDKLEAMVFHSQRGSQSAELGEAAKLEQNVPNPFTGATSIAYYLPATRNNAYINFYSSNGTLLKSVKLTGSGNGTVNITANELPAGVYQYSLIIDGKVMERKQMIQGK